MSNISQLASIAVASSAASVGWSGGRSLYRSLGKNAGLILLAATAVAGTGVSAFFLRRGTNRGVVGAFFLLFLPCLLLAILSIGAGYAFAFAFGDTDISRKAWIAILAWQGATFVAGWMIGAAPRRHRLKTHSIEAQNRRFLEGIGFRHVGGRERVWIDEDGRELVLHDRRVDALVFRIMNKRGGRSTISLDHDGRMLQYLPG